MLDGAAEHHGASTLAWPSAYLSLVVDSTGSTVGLTAGCEDSQALSIDKTQRSQSQRQRIAIRIDRL